MIRGSRVKGLARTRYADRARRRPVSCGRIRPTVAPAVGTRFGPYDVLGLLGTGGMGEVYRARDTRLKRDVALKVLPGPFASDAERLARFQREAEVLASLSHPNIAAIHGLEEADAIKALAMELVEGPRSSPSQRRLGGPASSRSWRPAADPVLAVRSGHRNRASRRQLTSHPV
jgi:serine/threonine protein kinase